MSASSISRKFQNISLLMTFSAIAILAIILIVAKYSDYIRERDSITENYFKEQEAIVKYEVDRAIDEIEADYKLTNLSLDEFKQSTVEKLRTVRFPNKGKELGFFFMRSFDGIQMLSVSLPKLEGTNTSKRKDPDGIITHEVFMSFMSNNTQSGYADYSWFNPVTKQVQKKRTYVKAIPEFECYLGAGFWFEDINTVIEAKKQKLIKDVWYYIIGILIITLIFYVVIYFIFKNVSKKIKHSFRKFSNFFEDAANEQVRVKTSGLYYKEFKDLAKSANKMISERIKAEEDYRIMAHALRSISECVSITDLDNKIIYVNDAFLKTYGFSYDDLIGKQIDVVGSKRNPIGLNLDILQETFRSGWKGEIWNKKKDGSEFQIYLSSSVIKNVKGEILALVGVSRDITEQKRSELLQRIIFNIAQAANTAIGLDKLIDIIKNQLQQIIDIKNFYIAFYNKKDDTFSSPYMLDEKDDFKSWPAGKTFTNYVFKTKKPQLLTKEKMEEFKKAGEVEYIGSVPEVWLGVPLKVKGEVFGVFAVQNYSDEAVYSKNDLEMLEFVSHQMSISIERKRTEEELQLAYEKAKESDRLKSAFLATMSHELRTPLNAVIGFSELIQMNSPIDKIMKYANTINNSGRHLLEIVEDIFDVTLLEIGQVNLQKEEYKLSSIMSSISEMILVEKIKLNSQIEIIYKPSKKYPDIEIYTDKNKLMQILINLLKNALKFTKEGHIDYGYEVNADKGEIEFYVKDTGIGIAKNKKNIVFNIFRQADESLTRHHGGTGIGLFVVKKYTEILGGKVELNSDLGKGSEFKVTLPILLQNHTLRSEDDNNDDVVSVNFDDKNVLVVEDDEFSIQLLVEILEGFGVNCLIARNGEEAIQICEQKSVKINLVLMDLKMPEMDGFEATKYIKEKWPEIKIIAQTAHAVPGDRERTLKAGFNDYISKPINYKELGHLLERYL